MLLMRSSFSPERHTQPKNESSPRPTKINVPSRYKSIPFLPAVVLRNSSASTISVLPLVSRSNPNDLSFGGFSSNLASADCFDSKSVDKIMPSRGHATKFTVGYSPIPPACLAYAARCSNFSKGYSFFFGVDSEVCRAKIVSMFSSLLLVSRLRIPSLSLSRSS